VPNIISVVDDSQMGDGSESMPLTNAKTLGIRGGTAGGNSTVKNATKNHLLNARTSLGTAGQPVRGDG
jgi:hypothetical protein